MHYENLLLMLLAGLSIAADNFVLISGEHLSELFVSDETLLDLSDDLDLDHV